MSENKKESKLLSSMANLSIFKKLKSIKHIEIIILAIFAILLVLICFSGNTFSFLTSTDNQEEDNGLNFVYSSQFISEMESRLKNVLSGIKGAGRVEVMITIERGSELVFAGNETITTSAGGSGTVTEKTIIIVTQNGVSSPIVISEILPKIKGVVIVSEGAKDISVRLNLLYAAQTLLSLDSQNIQVFAGN